MKKLFAQIYLWLLLVMLYAPIAIIAIFSFTESKVLAASGLDMNFWKYFSVKSPVCASWNA